MIALTVDNVDGYVAKLQRKGINVRWDGWKIVFLKADKRAVRSTDGRFMGGEWGFERVVEANKHGKWLIPFPLTKGSNA